jgi:hypothetical protein
MGTARRSQRAARTPLRSMRVTGLAILAVLSAQGAHAQLDQYGAQFRADAATQMIVLAVQQGAASLPPTAGQSFSYVYDSETLTFVANEQLGPTALLSTHTIGKGQFAVRAAASYFDLSQSFGPVTYEVNIGNLYYGKLGLDASARVGLFNIAATYGLTPRWELWINVPISVVDAEASQPFTTSPSTLDVPANMAPWTVANSPEGLDRLLRVGRVVIRNASFESLGYQFNGGTRTGVGRISLGAKGVLYGSERFRLAVAPQLFLPSPNEAEFAGPDSPAIYPRAVGQVKALDRLFFIVDLGYDYDFDESALRRFAWNVGAWIPGRRFSFDLGIGGSKYDTPIRWTPSLTSGSSNGIDFTVATDADNRLGTNFVDFIGGVKAKVVDQLVLSGAVAVPLTDDGFRPDALGTLALEYYF